MWEAIAGFFKALLMFDRWFSKTPSKEKESDVSDVRDRHDKFKKGPKK